MSFENSPYDVRKYNASDKQPNASSGAHNSYNPRRQNPVTPPSDYPYTPSSPDAPNHSYISLSLLPDDGKNKVKPGLWKPSNRRIGLLVLSIVVLLIGVADLVLGPIRNAQIANSHAFATAEAQDTAVARTAVAQGQTATAEAQATAIATNYPFSDKLILNDALTDANHGRGWTTSANCAFSNGAYHVTETKNKAFDTCPAPQSNFSNVTFQVTMSIIKGDIGGITFRGDDANNKFYAFIFDQTGSYALLAYSRGTNPRNLQTGSATSFHSGYGQANQISVTARGDAFQLFVNGQPLASVHDTAYNHGQIGMIVYDSGKATDIAFTDAKVWRL
ncbi:MAG TPA: hypothetical protein VKY19_03645 [Ktedonosporobacter sp.]|jgi:hypothetical protein|nr:hypothetical protein [Ktedonosporobacter sp.]